MEHIEEAVAVALNPFTQPDIKAQATNYLEQIKASPTGWQLCLSLFVKDPKSSNESRLVALQVIDEFLQLRKDHSGTEEINIIKKTLLEFIRQYYLSSFLETEPLFIRNKFCHTLTLIFTQLYPLHWKTFFDDFISLAMPSSDTSSWNLNMIDFFLRLLKAIDQEIINPSIARTSIQISKSNYLKDCMREQDIEKIVSFIYALFSQTAFLTEDIISACLEVIGFYISWIDISYVANDNFASFIFSYLKHPSLKMPACDCLMHICSKGMKAPEKLSLFQFLKLVEIIQTFSLDNTSFAEHLGKLANVVGQELKLIYDSLSPNHDLQIIAHSMMQQMMSPVYKFIESDSLSVNVSILPFISDLLHMYKRKKKSGIDPQDVTILQGLLTAIVLKMKYPINQDWSDDDESDEELTFAEFRKSLKVFLDSIAVIDEQLFSTFILSSIEKTLASFESFGESSTPWNDVELALNLTFLYSESLKPHFVPRNTSHPLKSGPFHDLLCRIFRGKIFFYPHPAIPIIFFDNVVRYSDFFDSHVDIIPNIFSAFLDQRGLLNSVPAHQERIWYLFFKFVRSLKCDTTPYLDQVISSIQELLMIRVDESELPAATNSKPHEPSASRFDYQLYLFEALGLMIGSPFLPDIEKSNYLEKIIHHPIITIQTLFQEVSNNSADALNLLRMHHSIMAVSSLVKGLPEIKSHHSPPPWTAILVNFTKLIVTSLEKFKTQEIIREATRFSFARLVTCLGSATFPYLLPLINGLLPECQIDELTDFLSFMCLILYRFKPSISSTLNDLITPLTDKVLHFMSQTPSGTDDAVLILELKKSFMNFLSVVFSSNLEAVFLSPTNLPAFGAIFSSVIINSLDFNNPALQKNCFVVLNRLTLAWATKLDNFDSEMRSSLYSFLKDHVIRVCFEVPLNPSFDLSDGQSSLVLSEIASLQKNLSNNLGVTYIVYLSNEYLPLIQCPPALGEEFIQALQYYDSKQFKRYLQTFFRKAKS